IILMLLILVSGQLIGCRPHTDTVCLLVEEDFTGLLCIQEVPDGGLNPRISNGFVYYDLTLTNRLATTDTYYLQTFHRLIAKYPSGRIIYGLPTKISPTETYVAR